MLLLERDVLRGLKLREPHAGVLERGRGDARGEQVPRRGREVRHGRVAPEVEQGVLGLGVEALGGHLEHGQVEGADVGRLLGEDLGDLIAPGLEGEDHARGEHEVAVGAGAAGVARLAAAAEVEGVEQGVLIAREHARHLLLDDGALHHGAVGHLLIVAAAGGRVVRGRDRRPAGAEDLEHDERDADAAVGQAAAPTNIVVCGRSSPRDRIGDGTGRPDDGGREGDRPEAEDQHRRVHALLALLEGGGEPILHGGIDRLPGRQEGVQACGDVDPRGQHVHDRVVGLLVIVVLLLVGGGRVQRLSRSGGRRRGRGGRHTTTATTANLLEEYLLPVVVLFV